MKSLKRIRRIRFGWKHVLTIFITVLIFQVFVSYLQQSVLRDLLSDTMDWYKQNSAEQIGNLTTTSLELLLESDPLEESNDRINRTKNLIHALNGILKQPLMKRNVEEMCVILPHNKKFVAMDLGQTVYSYFYDHQVSDTLVNPIYQHAVARYAGLHTEMMKSELISSFQEGQNIFHVFVPLVPYGEYGGAVYLKIHPDVSSISQQILANFNRTVLVFSSLALMGLLAIFYIATSTLIERDEAWELFNKEREEHVREHIAQEKEHLFTKRIYHTHHKAEKVMGFINEDLDNLGQTNIEEVKHRVSKYANFISRVIYDMKWFNPPLQTIRGQIFNTNLNELLRFIVDHIFLRISYPVKAIKFIYSLDDALPSLPVNEFVVWEIIEPLIQNSIDHCDRDSVTITITTKHNAENRYSLLTIEDDGKGIRPDLLEKGEDGIKRIFLESVTTKEDGKNRGYGCYLAYENAKRCGWELDADNRAEGGSRLTLFVKH